MLLISLATSRISFKKFFEMPRFEPGAIRFEVRDRPKFRQNFSWSRNAKKVFEPNRSEANLSFLRLGFKVRSKLLCLGFGFSNSYRHRFVANPLTSDFFSRKSKNYYEINL